MRKTTIVTSLLALIWLGYIAWPIYSLIQLTRAIETGDVKTVIAHVDFNSMRASLSNQIAETYLELTGRHVSPLVRGLASPAAAAVADPIIGRIASPEALTDFLRTGWPKAIVAQRPPGATGLSTGNLGTAWRIFYNANYGIRRFEIAVPTTIPAEHQFGFRFRLVNWQWMLSSVRLPKNIRILLAKALIKSLERKPR
jgi:Protein of unknown function (DUF2939)